MKKENIFTPEILSKSAKLRRVEYLKYVHDLLDFNYNFINTSDAQRGLDNKFKNEYPEEDLTFWIDPLDGSSGLTEGHTEHLTCIIGVSVNKRPLLGIVHKPFLGNESTDDNSLAQSRTYVGLPESGLFQINHYSKNNGKTHESTA